MTDLIALLVLLLSLYSANPAISDPTAAQGIISEYQAYGYDGALEKLTDYRQAADNQPGAPDGVLEEATGDALEEAPVGTPEEAPNKATATESSVSREQASDSTVPDAAESGDKASGTELNGSGNESGSQEPGADKGAEVETKPPEARPEPVEIKIDPSKLDYKKELTKLGYFREESKDGRLNLRNAVLRFQSGCNMTVDGQWDSECLNALARVLSTGFSLPVDTVASPPSEGMWIAVNKTKRILTLYEGSTILKKYPVAIGNPSSLTPEGKFTIVSKVIDPYWGGGGYAKPIKGGLPSNPLGHRWIGLSYKSGDDLGIHGNNSPYSIGKNISHGCIRMINSDVEELFEVIPKSASVWIGSESVLRGWGVTCPGIGT